MRYVDPAGAFCFSVAAQLSFSISFLFKHACLNLIGVKLSPPPPPPKKKKCRAGLAGQPKKNPRIYRLDFDALDWPPCHKDSEPGHPGSDYETWIPSDGTQHACPRGSSCECLLGQKVVYVRRKRMQQCFNRRKTKLPVLSEPCKCTMEDFECELDFVRALDQKSCVAISMPPPRVSFGPLQQQECAASGYYKADMYRRVPGNR